MAISNELLGKFDELCEKKVAALKLSHEKKVNELRKRLREVRDSIQDDRTESQATPTTAYELLVAFFKKRDFAGATIEEMATVANCSRSAISQLFYNTHPMSFVEVQRTGRARKFTIIDSNM